MLLVYNEGYGAAGVNEARLHIIASGTKSLESIPSTQVSETTIGILASPYCKKSHISGDGADGKHVCMETVADHSKTCTGRCECNRAAYNE